MEKYIVGENGISYVLMGDYYIPLLKLSEEKRPIGHWGRLHQAYLKQVQPMRYNELLLTCKLWTYLADLNEQAENRLELIAQQMKAAEDVTEEPKATQQMLQVAKMNGIRNRAEEIIKAEMICI